MLVTLELDHLLGDLEKYFILSVGPILSTENDCFLLRDPRLRSVGISMLMRGSVVTPDSELPLRFSMKTSIKLLLP